MFVEILHLFQHTNMFVEILHLFQQDVVFLMSGRRQSSPAFVTTVTCLKFDVLQLFYI